MELSKQVVSLELSQKIEKLGVKQDSLWWWTGVNIEWELRQGIGRYSAFTVAELMEGLPTYLESGNWDLTIQKTDVGYMVSYQNGYGECYKEESSCSLSVANALAMMHIYLVENKLMEV